MATIIKTWAAEVELLKTAAYGGSAAVVAADQKYDYTANVDLATAGNQGAHVEVGYRGNNDKDDIVVSVFASHDGSAFDTEPHAQYILKNDGKHRQKGFLVLDLAHFRIGLKSTGTNTTFEHIVTQRKWILTDA